MTKRLLPCPFCGGKPVRLSGNNAWIECERCVAKTCQCVTVEKAEDLWNTRTVCDELLRELGA